VSPNQYQFVLREPNQQEFQKYVPELLTRMKQIKSITDVTSDLDNDGLSVNVEVNRQLAARYGITPATIDNALYDASANASSPPFSTNQSISRGAGRQARQPP